MCATLLLFSRFFRLKFCFFSHAMLPYAESGQTVIFSHQQGRLSVLCLKCSIKSINQVERPPFLFGLKIRTRSTEDLLLTRLIHTRTHSHTQAHLATRDLRKKRRINKLFSRIFLYVLVIFVPRPSLGIFHRGQNESALRQQSHNYHNNNKERQCDNDRKS